MRAVGFFEPGEPDVLQVVDIPEPHPGPGEVRIRIHAAAVNPADTLRRAGRSSVPTAQAGPRVLGMDAAGVVDEVGEGAPWQIGDAVLTVVSSVSAPQGTYADRIVVPAESVTRLPEGVDFVAGSTLLMNALTASLTLEKLGLTAGQALLVTGSAGTYGGYVIQLAKRADLVVVADPSAADEDFVRGIGADLIVPRGDDFVRRVREVVPEGVDGVADGANLDGTVVGVVRDGGSIASLRGWTDDPGRGVQVHRVMVVDVMRDTPRLDDLADLAAHGALTLRVAAVFTPEQAAAAHRLVEAGGVRGRVVLDFSR